MNSISAAAYRESIKKPKRSKYNNVKTTVDGITFDSKAEAKYYQNLKLLEMAGEVEGVELQTPFALTVSGFLICTYRSDFTFTTRKDKKFHVVDCKGVRTKDFILKKKLMRAIYGIEIEEVRA
jgi:hypothetical protein